MLHQILDILKRINPNSGLDSWRTPPYAPGNYNSIQEPDMTSMTPFEPRMGAFNQMQDMIGAIPQRDQNPSLMRRIGAGIVGFGAGIKPQAVVGGQPIGASFDVEASNLGTDQFLNRKYYNEMSDWGAKFKALDPLVRAEGDINQNNRILYDASLDRKLRERTITRQEERDKDIYEKEQEQLAINRKNAETREMTGKAYALKASLPNYGTATDRSGRLVFYNKNDPKDIVQTTIDTGKLSDEDRISMQIEGQLDAIQARHEASLKEIEARGEKQIEVNEKRPVRSTSTGAGSLNANEMGKARALVNKANEAKRKHPEWAQWIKVEGQNVTITPPSTGRLFSRGPDKKTYDDINNFLESKASETNPTTKQVRNKTTGEIKEAYSYDGGKTWTFEKRK